MLFDWSHHRVGTAQPNRKWRLSILRPISIASVVDAALAEIVEAITCLEFEPDAKISEADFARRLAGGPSADGPPPRRSRALCRASGEVV
jgi:hypothetical protein